MSQRIVTHAIRSQNGNTLALCNPDADWRQRRKEWAITDILNDHHEYFVHGDGDNLVRIVVVNGPTGPYLRTSPDAEGANNLDNLPICTRNPWEVSLEDAEILAVHGALVSSAGGRVLLMGGDEHDKSNADAADIHNTRLYDAFTNTLFAADSPPADVFCCGHAFLPDGRWLVAGGTDRWRGGDEPDDDHVDAHGIPQNHWSGARDCAIFNPADQSWAVATPLLPEPGQVSRGGGRWYPTLITLADGRVLAVGGHPLVDPEDPNINDSRHGSWAPEIYDPSNNTWTYPGGHWLYASWGFIAEGEEPAGQVRPESGSNYLYYPRISSVPDGRVFLVSANDSHSGWYDPNTGITEMSLEPPPHGGRGYSETNHTAVLLPLLPGDNYTAHFLFLGHDGAHRISLSEGMAPTWQTTAARDWPDDQSPLRRHGCSVLLPTGEVFFCGGLNHDETEGGSPDENAVLPAEIYQAGINWLTQTYDFTEESWTTTPPASVVRNYHSIALLLPDGLVLTAGSNINGSTGGDDVKEYRIEIYSPWYDGNAYRPRISNAPDQLSYNQSFEITSPQATSIRRVALTRCGSMTHAWDGDQRYIGLSFEQLAPGLLQAITPPNGGIAPPGPYLLWIIDSSGRPCRRAQFVILS